jgi:uncharacterized protein with HEPN domain
MPSERTLQALRDKLENAKLAQSFVAGLDYLGFSADRRTVYAVTRCLEIVSEASRRLDHEVRRGIRKCRGVRSWVQEISIATIMIVLRKSFSGGPSITACRC